MTGTVERGEGGAMAELAFLGATELAELVRRREVKPLELVDGYLDRIERLDAALNSFVTLMADEARAAARAMEVSPPADRPPFFGVPISIKDLADTAGTRTTYSSRLFASHVPAADAPVVRRIRRAGFIPLGKTNTPEFGCVIVTESLLNGACRNPWATELSPGGSTGGGAAALAAGLCPISHGGDGGGSIRIPASACGLVGLKAARGRISTQWITGTATEGALSRTVRDTAAMLDVLAGYEVGDPYWAPPPARPFADEPERPSGMLRVAFTTAPPMSSAPVHPSCVAAVEDAARLLEDLGHDVGEAAPDWSVDDLLPMLRRLGGTGYAYNRGDLSMLEPINRVQAETGLQTNSVDYVEAQLAFAGYTRRVVPFWESFDVLLTPTMAVPPVPVGWLFDDPDPWQHVQRSDEVATFTWPVNFTGQPAISLPLYSDPDGLPIGVQLVARPADEATLLRLAAQLEKARPWRDRRPALAA